MKYFALTFWLTMLMLLSGCAGGKQELSGTGVVAPIPSPSVPPLVPNPQDISGNWQFDTRSISGNPAMPIAGALTQSGDSITAVVHIDGSNCFDHLASVGLTGSLTDGNLALTSAPVNGQVITFAGNITIKMNSPDTLTGTYVINGGCASGDNGNLTGETIHSVTGNWAGDLTSTTGEVNRIAVELRQGAVGSDGSYGLTGTVYFESGVCFQSGKITPETFPSGSYVLGNAANFEIETDNGVIVFLGRAEGDGLIRGNFTVSGGTCESAGTGYLSPWED